MCTRCSLFLHTDQLIKIMHAIVMAINFIYTSIIKFSVLFSLSFSLFFSIFPLLFWFCYFVLFVFVTLSVSHPVRHPYTHELTIVVKRISERLNYGFRFNIGRNRSIWALSNHKLSVIVFASTFWSCQFFIVRFHSWNTKLSVCNNVF